MDHGDTRQGGTGPCSIEDLSNGDPGLLLLVGDRDDEPFDGGCGGRRPRERQPEHGCERFGLRIGVALGMATDDGDRTGLGQGDQEATFRCRQPTGKVDHERGERYRILEESVDSQVRAFTFVVEVRRQPVE